MRKNNIVNLGLFFGGIAFFVVAGLLLFFPSISIGSFKLNNPLRVQAAQTAPEYYKVNYKVTKWLNFGQNKGVSLGPAEWTVYIYTKAYTYTEIWHLKSVRVSYSVNKGVDSTAPVSTPETEGKLISLPDDSGYAEDVKGLPQLHKSPDSDYSFMIERYGECTYNSGLYGFLVSSCPDAPSGTVSDGGSFSPVEWDITGTICPVGTTSCS